MCYEMDLWLLTHDTEAKACDYEATETLSHKANRKSTNRGDRRKATAKAKRRHAETEMLRKKHAVKAERDDEMVWTFCEWRPIGCIHDSKLWKPLRKDTREKEMRLEYEKPQEVYTYDDICVTANGVDDGWHKLYKQMLKRGLITILEYRIEDRYHAVLEMGDLKGSRYDIINKAIDWCRIEPLVYLYVDDDKYFVRREGDIIYVYYRGHCMGCMEV